MTLFLFQIHDLGTLQILSSQRTRVWASVACYGSVPILNAWLYHQEDYGSLNTTYLSHPEDHFSSDQYQKYIRNIVPDHELETPDHFWKSLVIIFVWIEI